MTESPYSPPQTRVADAPPRSGTRPRSATIALILFGLFVVGRCNRLRFSLENFRTGEISGLMFLMDVAVIGFFIVIGILLAKRVGWVRWILVAIATWQVYDLNWGLRALMEVSDRISIGPMDIIIWLAPAAYVVGTVIVVFGPARAWFGGRQ
jgi:hypothetical protein